MDPATVPPTTARTVITGRVRRGHRWERSRLWLADGRIAAVTGTDGAVPDGVESIDVGQAYLLPGAVDAHVHCLSHPGEGITAGTSAAAAGGVTTIVEMPFDGTGAINTVDRLRAKQDLVADEAVIDVALLGTLAPGGGWRQAAAMAGAGAVGFKVSLFLTDPVRFPRIDDLELQSVMAAVGEIGSTLCTHAENNEIIKGLLSDPQAQDSTDPLTHVRTRPPVSETLGALTALETAATHGNALHVCHLSLPRSIDLVGWYQDQGADVTMEVCPHYLVFTEDDMRTRGGRLKINPPLRSTDDREGLWRDLAAGRIGVISSDHAPWPTALKDHERILDNHSGVPGVETLVTVTLAEALRRDPTGALFDRALDALTIGPARRYGLDERKGSLEPGKDADVVVFDPTMTDTIRAERMHSHAGWTPYDGFTHTGTITHTFNRGRLVFSRDAGLLARPGDGTLVRRRSR